MNPAGFKVSDSCVGCGRCVKVCPGGILYMGEDGRPRIGEFEEFGWNGCWQCEHCLAVCPEGSVSILGRRPEDSLAAPEPDTAGEVLDSLVMNRRSCRRYQKRNVPKTVIEDMLAKLANAPNGGNKQLVEYTLVDDTGQMEYFRNTAYREMERLAAQGIYPEGFGKEAYEDMKRWGKTVRPDMLFCGAPHILSPHAPVSYTHLGAGRHGRADEGTHHLCNRPPSVHGQEFGLYHGNGAGPDHRARNPRRSDCTERKILPVVYRKFCGLVYKLILRDSVPHNNQGGKAPRRLPAVSIPANKYPQGCGFEDIGA